MAAKKPKPKRDQVVSSGDLAKKYPGAGVASVVTIPSDDMIWVPSRCIPLTYSMGGGLSYGRIAEIYGTESGGKTLAAIDFGYVVQQLGGEIIWNDAEQSFTPYWAEQNGLDLSRIHIWNSTSVEFVSDWLADTMLSVRSRLKANEPILFIQDSLAALDCEANINATQTDSKAEMGNRAKAIYKMLRIRNQLIADLGVMCIFINQLRDKVGAGMFEDPETTPGGKAMKYFAHQRIGFYAGRQINEGPKSRKKRIGVEVSVRLKKNKLAPPRPTFKSEIYFDPEGSNPLGFNRYLGLLDILVDTEVVTRSAGGVYFRGDRIARSEDAFGELIISDTELRAKLLKRSEVNTISRARKKLEGITSNLYPVKATKVISQLEVPDDDEDE